MGKIERFRRHGDVYLIESDRDADDIRSRGKRISSSILAFGEKTGHKHELETMDGVERYELDLSRARYLIVSRPGGVRITHAEHGIGLIEPGVHREVIDREYNYLANIPRDSRD